MVRNRKHRIAIHWDSLKLLIAFLLSLFVVYDQVFNRIGLDYLWDEQLRLFHRSVIEGTAINPWQFRILSPYLLEGLKQILSGIGIDISYIRLFIGFRFLQTFVIFLLAVRYWERFGITRRAVYVLLAILAWGMAYGTWGSGLAIDTYFDILFYLLAGLAILAERYAWIVPLSLVSALNRETGIFIPLLPIAAAVKFKPGFKIEKKALLPSLISSGLFLLLLFAVRLHYGPRPVYGLHPPGFDLLLYNLSQVSSYFSLFATYSVLPLIAFLTWKRWPNLLKRFSILMVPLWLLVHFAGGIVAEARLFLVPYVLIILPAVGATLQEPSRNAGEAPTYGD